MLLHSRRERRAHHAPGDAHATSACNHFQSNHSSGSSFSHRISAADCTVISKFRSLVAGLDQSCSFIDSRRAFRECQKGFRRRLALGHDLFLWDLLVANLSDDPLRTDARLDRLFAVADSDSFCSALPSPVLCRCLSNDQTIRRIGDSVNADSLGFM